MLNLSPVRLLTLVVAAVLLLLLLLVAVLLTDTLLNIRHNLERAPDWVWMLVLTGFGFFSLFSGWLIIRILRPSRKAAQPLPEVVDEDSVREKLAQTKASGVDTALAEQELEKLQQRRQAGIIHIALYGEISSGKSSLIKALLPHAEVNISVKGGTTQQLDEYRWSSAAGDQLVLTDMPGLNETGLQQQQLSRQEALRAHLVIYLCDGDLTRSQMDELAQLAGLKKPLILALNKTDRYSAEQLQQLKERLQQRVKELNIRELITIRSATTQQVIRITADGCEEPVERAQPALLDELKAAIQRIIDGDPQVLETLRDSAVFSLIGSQLDTALAQQREQQALDITRSYSTKAVVAAVAAITPGTDILIQGYLATQMIKELSELYQIPVRKLDVELLLKLVQQHVRTHVTLLLAVAGNALKAFPGAGTLTGGILHAIAYGFLFETLGKSIARSLHSRGELHPLQVASQFEENLGENIKTSAGYYAALAFRQLRKKD
ncbi:MAG: GTPase domain-containing protein [Gammaproteobacteria bacterium]|nr:GTPase domain-containing protein [Gammaproteobacteria bacterium]MBL6999613.1 GTPase domain-containing protein [Gammaproteobacteria bacterium]